MTENTQMETDFRDTMASYPTGVTVVTAMNEKGEPMGLTVNSFASLSLKPLLILWSIDKRVSTYDEFLKTDRFSVNILASDQQDECMLFATRGEDRFGKCDWTESRHKLPVLSNTLATIQCKKYNQVDAGDHTIMIGEVVDIQLDREKAPLLYHDRTFGQIPEVFYDK